MSVSAGITRTALSFQAYRRQAPTPSQAGITRTPHGSTETRRQFRQGGGFLLPVDKKEREIVVIIKIFLSYLYTATLIPADKLVGTCRRMSAGMRGVLA